MVKLRLLKSIFFINPGFNEPPEGKVTSLTLSIKNSGDFINDGKEARFIQNFQVQNNPNTPFSMEVEFGAIFTLSTPVPLEERDYYVHVVFPQLIFPFLREYVAETTRRGGFPPLLLNISLSPEPRDSSGEESRASLPVVAKWIH
jgi:preprotein translocase subunit SecB